MIVDRIEAPLLELLGLPSAGGMLDAGLGPRLQAQLLTGATADVESVEFTGAGYRYGRALRDAEAMLSVQTRDRAGRTIPLNGVALAELRRLSDAGLTITDLRLRTSAATVAAMGLAWHVDGDWWEQTLVADFRGAAAVLMRREGFRRLFPSVARTPEQRRASVSAAAMAEGSRGVFTVASSMAAAYLGDPRAVAEDDGYPVVRWLVAARNMETGECRVSAASEQVAVDHDAACLVATPNTNRPRRRNRLQTLITGALALEEAGKTQRPDRFGHKEADAAAWRREHEHPGVRRGGPEWSDPTGQVATAIADGTIPFGALATVLGSSPETIVKAAQIWQDHGLTLRQAVVRLLRHAGFSDAESAQLLQIARSTVERHFAAGEKKLRRD